jgi:ABC-type multidrug transport system fused ATPase/permease subunit
MSEINTWMALRSATQHDSRRNGITRATVRRVARFARPHRQTIIAYLGLATVAAVLGVATPILAGQAVEAIVDGGATSRVLVLAGLIGVVAVADSGIGLLTRLQSSRLGEGLILDLRSRVFEHVQSMPVAFFTRTRTGVARVLAGISAYRQSATTSGTTDPLYSRTDRVRAPSRGHPSREATVWQKIRDTCSAGRAVGRNSVDIRGRARRDGPRTLRIGGRIGTLTPSIRRSILRIPRLATALRQRFRAHSPSGSHRDPGSPGRLGRSTRAAPHPHPS